jgi:hypothetical protein
MQERKAKGQKVKRGKDAKKERRKRKIGIYSGEIYVMNEAHKIYNIPIYIIGGLVINVKKNI